jgi:hypothetical protein
MLRELSSLLIEMHEGLLAIESRQLGPGQLGSGPRIALSGVEMQLPLALRPVFRGGGCRLLAGFARSSGIDDWTPLVSQLHLQWSRDPAALGSNALDDNALDASGETAP